MGLNTNLLQNGFGRIHAQPVLAHRHTFLSLSLRRSGHRPYRHRPVLYHQCVRGFTGGQLRHNRGCRIQHFDCRRFRQRLAPSLQQNNVRAEVEPVSDDVLCIDGDRSKRHRNYSPHHLRSPQQTVLPRGDGQRHCQRRQIHALRRFDGFKCLSLGQISHRY